MLLAVCAAAVTLVNAYLESRSQRAIKSTLRRASPKAIVIRDGREFSVDSRALVPGDVIRLEVGRIVPVLVEGSSRRDDRVLDGKSPRLQTVHARLADGMRIEDLIGRIVDVHVESATTNYLQGTLV